MALQGLKTRAECMIVSNSVCSFTKKGLIGPSVNVEKTRELELRACVCFAAPKIP